jgi:hypothetical protein
MESVRLLFRQEAIDFQRCYGVSSIEPDEC